MIDRDRDVVDVDLVLPDQVQQQVERPLEVQEPDRVGLERRLERFHGVSTCRCMASRTCPIVSTAIVRALREPASRISRTRPGVPASSARRARSGSSAAFRALISFCFTSTSPTVPSAVARLEVVDLGGVGVEGVVVDEHRVAFDGAGRVGAHALRVGVHRHHLLLHLVRGVGEVDGVAVALAHLAVVDAGQAREPGEHRLRLDEHLAVEPVEAAHDLARQLQVRHLVIAHRHRVGVVDHDVRGLQQRVAEEAVGGEIAVGDLLLLLLVGRDALEPRRRRDHRQQQVQLGVLRHHRLDEQRALLRIDAGGDPVGGVVEGVGRDLLRVRVLAGQRVPVGHEVEAVEPILELDPVAQRAHQVPEMELSGRAHPRHDTFGHHDSSRNASRLMGGCTIARQHPGEEQRVEHDEAVLAGELVEGQPGPQRQQVRQHLAAIERRNRDQVEDHQPEVGEQAARRRRPTAGRSAARTDRPEPVRRPAERGSRPRRRSPAAGCWPGRPARSG